ncbi:hypothetical protein [Desulfonema magnum]|uniref:Uncharacterized protein n=1 Tax=Desulfonema magnum TaxID=45655 RepID=A0A975GRN2_9BACT|nr:hypothetical protein [Desulfonema magnum]QTA91199.1 Uncharacterized protein dnm_072640 [Desulfonema magnum]
MTKVANSQAIENAKSELVEKVKAALNLSEIKKILEDQHNLEISDDLEVNSGEMVIHNNQLGYKMEFEVLLSLSVLLDGDGNYIPPEDTPEENIDQLGTQVGNIIQDVVADES